MNAHPVNRTATPLSASLHNTRSMWNRSAASVTALPRSPTDSAGPHYYDYSESFLEEECFQPGCQDESDIQLSHMMDHAVHESQTDIERRQAQSPFGTLPGSTFKPAELPTNHNRRASEQSKHSFSGVIPRRVSSLAATSNHQESRESSFVCISFSIVIFSANFNRPRASFQRLSPVKKKKVINHRTAPAGRLSLRMLTLVPSL